MSRILKPTQSTPSLHDEIVPSSSPLRSQHHPPLPSNSRAHHTSTTSTASSGTQTSTSTSLSYPTHPIPTLASAFLESIHDSFTPPQSPTPGVHHRLTKLVAQLTFGLHLLHTSTSRSETRAVAILQSHISDFDAFLSTTTASLELSQTDIQSRLDALRFQLAAEAIFSRMLQDRHFRQQILHRNQAVGHVIRRSRRGLDVIKKDIDAALEAVDECARFLLGVKEGWPNLGLERVYAAMVYNVRMWFSRCWEAGLKVERVESVVRELDAVVVEIEKRTGRASRRNIVDGQRRLPLEGAAQAAAMKLEKPLPKSPSPDLEVKLPRLKMVEAIPEIRSESAKMIEKAAQKKNAGQNASSAPVGRRSPHPPLPSHHHSKYDTTSVTTAAIYGKGNPHQFLQYPQNPLAFSTVASSSTSPTPARRLSKRRHRAASLTSPTPPSSTTSHPRPVPPPPPSSAQSRASAQSVYPTPAPRPPPNIARVRPTRPAITIPPLEPSRVIPVPIPQATFPPPHSTPPPSPPAPHRLRSRSTSNLHPNAPSKSMIRDPCGDSNLGLTRQRSVLRLGWFSEFDESSDEEAGCCGVTVKRGKGNTERGGKGKVFWEEKTLKEKERERRKARKKKKRVSVEAVWGGSERWGSEKGGEVGFMTESYGQVPSRTERRKAAETKGGSGGGGGLCSIM